MLVRAAAAGLLAAALAAGCGSAGDDPPRAKVVAGPPPPALHPVKARTLPPVPAGRRPRHLSVAITRPTVLRARPGGRRLARLGTKTTFGSPRILAVVGSRGAWLRVLTDALPNGRSGWVSARDGLMYPVDWVVDVSLARRQVTVRHGGRVVQRFPVAIGRPGNPTPTGDFAVTDKVRMRDPGGPYGCCALALTAHQPNIPQGWGGGDRVAIHGTSQPGSIGYAASLGCLRAGESDVRRLVGTVPLGAPVRIHA
jgi:L,D-transpeptidase-like protein